MNSLHEDLTSRVLSLTPATLGELRYHIESLERAKRTQDTVRAPLIAADIASFFYRKDKEE